MNHIKTIEAAEFRRLLELGFHAEIVKSKRPFAAGDLYHHQEVTDTTTAGTFTGSEFTAKIESVQSGKHLNRNCYQIIWRIIDTRNVLVPAVPSSNLDAVKAAIEQISDNNIIITERIPDPSGQAVDLPNTQGSADGGTASMLATNTASSPGSNEKQVAEVVPPVTGGKKGVKGGTKKADTAPAANSGAAVVTEPGDDDNTKNVSDLF